MKINARKLFFAVASVIPEDAQIEIEDRHPSEKKAEGKASERLLTGEEVAKELGIAYSTVMLWLKTGFLPQSIKIGGGIKRRHFWREEDIKRFKDQHNEQLQNS